MFWQNLQIPCVFPDREFIWSFSLFPCAVGTLLLAPSACRRSMYVQYFHLAICDQCGEHKRCFPYLSSHLGECPGGNVYKCYHLVQAYIAGNWQRCGPPTRSQHTLIYTAYGGSTILVSILAYSSKISRLCVMMLIPH